MIKNIKTIIASAVLIALAACGSPPNTATNNTPPASPESPTASPATPSTEPAASSEGIIFKEVNNKLYGYVDSLNNSKATPQRIQLNKAIQLAGWAITPDQKRPADSVLITYGDTNTVATTIPVGLSRPDVADALKNPTLEKSGWLAVINPATLALSGEKTTFKAWSYNSQTKEAYPLINSFEIVGK